MEEKLPEVVVNISTSCEGQSVIPSKSCFPLCWDSEETQKHVSWICPIKTQGKHTSLDILGAPWIPKSFMSCSLPVECQKWQQLKKQNGGGFPGGTVVGNLPANAGDTG